MSNEDTKLEVSTDAAVTSSMIKPVTNRVKWYTRSSDSGRGYRFGTLLAWVGCPDGAHAVIFADDSKDFVDRRYDQVWPA